MAALQPGLSPCRADATGSAGTLEEQPAPTFQGSSVPLPVPTTPSTPTPVPVQSAVPASVNRTAESKSFACGIPLLGAKKPQVASAQQVSVVEEKPAAESGSQAAPPQACPPQRERALTESAASTSAKGKGKGKAPPPPPGKAPPGKGAPPINKAQGGGPLIKKRESCPSIMQSSAPFGRKVHWSRVESVEGTIFGEMAEADENELNVASLQEMFFRESKGPKTSKVGAQVEAAEGRQAGKVCLLDSKRAQNIAIVLRRVATNTERFCEALNKCEFDDEI